MRLFYTILLWVSERELAIALSTGRNPENIKKIRGDVKRWQDALDDYLLPNLFD